MAFVYPDDVFEEDKALAHSVLVCAKVIKHVCLEQKEASAPRFDVPSLLYEVPFFQAPEL